MAGLFDMFKKKPHQIGAPVKGDALPLADVPDPAFSGEILGKGVAFKPKNGKVVAPADGKITTMFPTGHAFTMETKDGIEILVHVGLETVKLNGAPFTIHAAEGQTVKKGELILEADLDAIQKAGCEIITPMVICNSDDYRSITSVVGKEVAAGEDVLQIES